METYTQLIPYIPAAVSAVLTAALILTVVTNVIVQVLKGVTDGHIPTNALAVVVALIVTIVAFLAVCSATGTPIYWYTFAGAIGLGFAVAFAAMFGFDKLKEALEQITKR